MKIFNNKYLPLFLGIMLIFIWGCKPYQSLTIEEPQTVKIKSATFNNMSLDISLPIHNPNFYPIKAKKLHAKVYINENAVGTITNTETIKIPANSNKVHNLEIDIDYSDIFDSGFSLRKILKEKNLVLNLRGTLTVKSFLMKRKIEFDKSKSIDF
jgi:LEA14-like dessication related protein